MVVYTPAIPKSNKQFVFFQQSSFKILKRSELLGIISKNKFCIAVAGTHGKTTTASILSHILLENNINLHLLSVGSLKIIIQTLFKTEMKLF